MLRAAVLLGAPLRIDAGVHFEDQLCLGKSLPAEERRAASSVARFLWQGLDPGVAA